jgi:putative copper resistance protein D
LDDTLVWVRAVHFAANISLTGALFFLAFIAEPVFRRTDNQARIFDDVRSWVSWIGWSSLALVVLSGAGWLIFKAAQMGDVPWQEVFSENIVSEVLSGTGFGQDWIMRSVLAALLATALVGVRPERDSYRVRLLAACILSAVLVGTLAWAGHAAATPDMFGSVHIASDVLHLVAAAAWVGALLPLALLIGAVLARHDPQSVAIGREAVGRFSILGIISVGTLALSGIVNSLAILGSVTALFGTDYGRLLLAKIALFLVMLSLASVNRFRLTPLVHQKLDDNATRSALRRIQTNTLLEATTGLLVVIIVGLLGTVSPSL